MIRCISNKQHLGWNDLLIVKNGEKTVWKVNQLENESSFLYNYKCHRTWLFQRFLATQVHGEAKTNTLAMVASDPAVKIEPVPALPKGFNPSQKCFKKNTRKKKI